MAIKKRSFSEIAAHMRQVMQEPVDFNAVEEKRRLEHHGPLGNEVHKVRKELRALEASRDVADDTATLDQRIQTLKDELAGLRKACKKSDRKRKQEWKTANAQVRFRMDGTQVDQNGNRIIPPGSILREALNAFMGRSK